MAIAFLLLFQASGTKTIITFFLLFMGLGSYFILERKLIIDNYIISIVLIILISIVFIGVLNSRSTLVPISLFLSNFVLGLFLFRNKHYSNLYFLLVGGFAAIFIIKFLGGISPNNIFNEASRNWVSIIMQTASILYYITRHENNEKLSIFPALFTFIISIWAIGRAGIICSSFLLLGVIFLRAKSLSSYQKAILILATVSITLLVYFLFKENIDLFLAEINMFKRFEEKGMGSGRSRMISEYLNHINLKTLLFGYDYTQNSFFRLWHFNPHNSFIRLHYYTGFVGILIFFFQLFILFIYSLKNQLYFILFSIILIRGFADTILFFGLYDFLVFYFIFDFIHNFWGKYSIKSEIGILQ